MPPALTDSEDETYETMAPVSSQKDKNNGTKAKESADEDEQEVLNVESADEKDDGKDDDKDDGKDDDKDEDDEGQDEAEDVYTVEKIISHRFETDGQIRFKIKWEGYSKISDQTWEPEENLDTAKDMVEEYFESLGGRQKVMAGKNSGKADNKKRARQSTASAPASTKKAKTERKSATRSTTPETKVQTFSPPSGSWEDEVKAIDAAEGPQGQVQVYLTWRDGHKTQHPLHVCYKRCPQKMLRFFESHLVFRKA